MGPVAHATVWGITLLLADSLVAKYRLQFIGRERHTMRNSARLDKARALVVEDPGILSGTPVIRNTRIPVYDVAASVAAGLSTNNLPLKADRILAAYPGLAGEMVELAALYATLSPPKERPRDHSSPPAVLIISRRRTSHRK